MSIEAMQAAGIIGAIQTIQAGRAAQAAPCDQARGAGAGGPLGVAALTPGPGIADAFTPRGPRARRRWIPRVRLGTHTWRATGPAAADTCGDRGADGAGGAREQC